VAVGVSHLGGARRAGKPYVMVFSDAGNAVRFSDEEVRPMGRTAGGVRGMRLLPGQRVISLLTSRDETLAVLTATEFGYGKRTPIAEYTRHGRGTQGMIAIQSSERNGSLVAALLVGNEDGIMLITTGGVLIRTRVSEIRELGRSTQGVRLINLGDNEKLEGLEKVLEPDEVEDATVGVSIVEAEAPPSAGDDASPAADESSPE
jgi:DNA gyrase subunit A